MTPLSSIATIDDLIVALTRLGYKKIYEVSDFGREQTYNLKGNEYLKTFVVWKVPKENLINIFIYYKDQPNTVLLSHMIDKTDIVEDITLTATVVGEFYPHINRWWVNECFEGKEKDISFEEAEFIDLNNIDNYLDKTIKEWAREDVIF